MCYTSNATRLGRTSIVANVIGEGDTHHGVNETAPYGEGAAGLLWLDVDYFDFFDPLFLPGQIDDGFIQGLAELPSPFPRHSEAGR